MLRIENWGEVPYQEATSRQLQYVEEVFSGQRPETLIVCTHSPVVTLGRGTQAGDVFGWTGETVETSRGGRATYHGPNQIVIYPILNLAAARKNIDARDLHDYMRLLEAALVTTLKEFGLDAEARTVKVADGPSLTGVWVGEHKIASLGIAIKKWVSYHGLALNVTHDPLAFTGINPCGFSTSVMTSVETELGSNAGDPAELRERVQGLLVAELAKLLS
ncbi:MAG: lipoyl(octanoyl) transferase LipB [Bdellovibrionota bacterium]